MAIGVTAGSWAAHNASTAMSVSLPSHAAGDLLCVAVGWKFAATTDYLDAPGGGWTVLEEGNNGTTTSGNGTGSVRVALIAKVATSSSESLSLQWRDSTNAAKAPSPGCAHAWKLTKDSGYLWVFPLPVCTGGDTSSGTGYSATMNAARNWDVGDVGLAFTVIMDNLALTVPTFTASGITFSTVTESPATALSSTTGNDIAADGCYRTVTSGSGTQTPIVTGTIASAGTGTSGVFRIRQKQPFTQSVSGGITPSGSLTNVGPSATGTARLSLAAGGVPPTRTGHRILVRARTTSGSGKKLYAALYEGSTNRSGDLSVTVTNSLADYELVIPDASAANISSYQNLELRLWGRSPTGGSFTFEVDYAALAVPGLVLRGYLTPTGTVDPQKVTSTKTKAISGAITPTGALAKKPRTLDSGAITPTGAKTLKARRAWGGAITPTGAVTPRGKRLKSVSGALTPTGALAKKPLKRLSGAITPTGAKRLIAKRRWTGAITPSGALTKETVKRLSGAITPTGAVGKKPLKRMAGAITPTGTVTKRALRRWAGAITPAGALVKRVAKRLSGAITPTGATAAAKIGAKTQAVSGSVTPTGAVSLKPGVTGTARLSLSPGSVPPTRTGHRIVVRARVTSGSGSLRARLYEGSTARSAVLDSGALTTSLADHELVISDSDAASIGSYQNLEVRFWGNAASGAGITFEVEYIALATPALVLRGVLSPTGSLATQKITGIIQRSMSGALTPAGALFKKPRILDAGAVTPAGTKVLKARRAWSGSITPAGAFRRLIRIAKTGSVTPAGALTKRALKRLAGALTPAGSVTTFVPGAGTKMVAVSGSLAPAGVLVNVQKWFLSLAGAITPVGTIYHYAYVISQQPRAWVRRLGWTARQPLDLGWRSWVNEGTASPWRWASVASLAWRVGVVRRLETWVPPTSGTGAIAKAGGISPAGALVKRGRKRMAAAVAMSGVVMKKSKRRFSGALAPFGVVGRVKIPGGSTPQTKAVAGALMPAGEAVSIGPVRQVNVTQTGFALDWWPRPGMTGRVEYATNPSFTGSLLTVKETNYLTYHRQTIGLNNPPGAPALTPGTTYYCRIVESTTAGGKAIQSATYALQTAVAQRSSAGTIMPAGAVARVKYTATKKVSVGGAVTPAGGHAALGDVAASSITDSGFTVGWKAYPAMTGRIQYGTDPTLASSLLTVKETSYLPAHSQSVGLGNPPGAPALTPGTTYYYRVTESTTPAGVNAQSIIRSVLTTGGTVPVVGTRYPVPSIIDQSGSAYVNTELQAFIDRVPNGTAGNPSLIIFPSTATYKLRVGGALRLTNRHYVHLYGLDPATTNFSTVTEVTQRCTILQAGDAVYPTTGGGAFDSAFAISPYNSVGSTNLKIIGFVMKGSNPYGGTTSATYSVGNDTQGGVFGYSAGGVAHIEVAYNNILDQRGHAMYVRSNEANTPYPDDYYIHHNVIRGTGVQGLAISNGTNHRIEDNQLIDIGCYPIDFEDAVHPSYLTNISVKRNYIENGGWNPTNPAPWWIVCLSDLVMTNIEISDNTFAGIDHSNYDLNWDYTRGIIDIRPGRASSGLVVSGNVSSYVHDGTQVVAHNFNGVTVTNNRFSGSPTGRNGVNHSDVVLSTSNCSNVSQSGNTWLVGPY